MATVSVIVEPTHLYINLDNFLDNILRKYNLKKILLYMPQIYI